MDGFGNERAFKWLRQVGGTPLFWWRGRGQRVSCLEGKGHVSKGVWGVGREGCMSLLRVLFWFGGLLWWWWYLVGQVVVAFYRWSWVWGNVGEWFAGCLLFVGGFYCGVFGGLFVCGLCSVGVATVFLWGNCVCGVAVVGCGCRVLLTEHFRCVFFGRRRGFVCCCGGWWRGFLRWFDSLEVARKVLRDIVTSTSNRCDVVAGFVAFLWWGMLLGSCI